MLLIWIYDLRLSAMVYFILHTHCRGDEHKDDAPFSFLLFLPLLLLTSKKHSDTAAQPASVSSFPFFPNGNNFSLLGLYVQLLGSLYENRAELARGGKDDKFCI